MGCHTKTTLNIDDTVMARLRQEAARQRKTMSELVEAALRRLFYEHRAVKKKKLPALPTFNSGGFLVDSQNSQGCVAVAAVYDCRKETSSARGLFVNGLGLRFSGEFLEARIIP